MYHILNLNLKFYFGEFGTIDYNSDADNHLDIVVKKNYFNFKVHSIVIKNKF